MDCEPPVCEIVFMESNSEKMSNPTKIISIQTAGTNRISLAPSSWSSSSHASPPIEYYVSTCEKRRSDPLRSAHTYVHMYSDWVGWLQYRNRRWIHMTCMRVCMWSYVKDAHHERGEESLSDTHVMRGGRDTHPSTVSAFVLRAHSLDASSMTKAGRVVLTLS